MTGPQVHATLALAAATAAGGIDPVHPDYLAWQKTTGVTP